ncbi:hypothetical protein APR04_000996 [Promicromonospora umidemergens]|uniref:DUF2993 domain-containing protein n=1 Tax=Promicromonospora umidemergens TaxID=629679 RepID=A0ABP8XKJ3_9MICO|nr:hypothetical protein [Promicromonospora umidemergens]MCP2282101.1 hypothetical protein [Promicromonospora umidemergens]
MTDAAQRPAPDHLSAERRTPDPIPLGTAPRPADGADLAARIRAALAEELGGTAVGLDRASITTVLDGASVASADIDLSGVVVRTDGVPGPADPDKRWRPEIVRREPGTLRRLRLDAHRIVAVDLPVDVTAELEGLRFEWVESSDGRVGVLPVEPTQEHPVSGHARVAVDKAGLVATARGLLTVVLQQQGITLTGLDVDLVSEGPRAATLRVDAAIKKGMFLSARVQATASVSVDANMVLAVRDVRLASGNPLVAALLGTIRGRVEAATSRDIDLAEKLPAGVRLADVRLDVGQELVASARLA